MIIGILALQGDYSLHAKILDNNNVNNILIKTPSELSHIDGLIIPGGESTVILKLLDKFDFNQGLKDFSSKKHIYGTCAGAIVMSRCTNDNLKTLNFINIKSFRNFWGRQINSFTDNIKLTLNVFYVRNIGDLLVQSISLIVEQNQSLLIVGPSGVEFQV